MCVDILLKFFEIFCLKCKFFLCFDIICLWIVGILCLLCFVGNLLVFFFLVCFLYLKEFVKLGGFVG